MKLFFKKCTRNNPNDLRNSHVNRMVHSNWAYTDTRMHAAYYHQNKPGQWPSMVGQQPSIHLSALSTQKPALWTRPQQPPNHTKPTTIQQTQNSTVMLMHFANPSQSHPHQTQWHWPTQDHPLTMHHAVWLFLTPKWCKTRTATQPQMQWQHKKREKHATMTCKAPHLNRALIPCKPR